MNPQDPCYPNRPEWLKRPARRQVDDATLQKEIQARGGYGEVNLWSGRRIGPTGPAGGSEGKRAPGGARVKDASKYRCVLEADVGRTRGSDAKQHVFCLYFAKGCCSQGSACTYLHRLPTAEDEAYAVRDLSADIFGREKRAESEGYRKGAGTLERDNRTLYVNYEGAGSYELPKIRQLLEANFRAFGPVNNIYILHHKTVAFVRYDWRSSAEFAKEAVHKQGLLGSKLGEVITARWANEDPNPVAVLAQKRAAEEAFGLAVVSSFDALPPEQKQARIQELQLQSALRRGAAIGSYPATEQQFAAREAQERELALRRQQAAAAAAAAREAGGGADWAEQDEEEDIPYIPPDIYEEQQRLLAQRREAPAAVAAPPSPHQQYPSQDPRGRVEAEVTHLGALPPAAEQGGGDSSAAAGGGTGREGEMDTGPFKDGVGPAAAAGVGSGEMTEWERAWHDPEMREKMRADPEMRERMRRARNEAVYWSAYQAHYHAYAHSYGHHTGQQPEQQAVGQGQGDAWQGDYAAWSGYGHDGSGYGQQGPGEPAEGGAAAGYTAGSAASGYGAPTGYGAGYEWFGQQAATGTAEGGAGPGEGGGGADCGGQQEGAEGKGGGAGKSGTAGVDFREAESDKAQADGLSLLGAYGSDDDEDG